MPPETERSTSKAGIYSYVYILIINRRTWNAFMILKLFSMSLFRFNLLLVRCHVFCTVQNYSQLIPDHCRGIYCTIPTIDDWTELSFIPILVCKHCCFCTSDPSPFSQIHFSHFLIENYLGFIWINAVSVFAFVSWQMQRKWVKRENGLDPSLLPFGINLIWKLCNRNGN